MTNNPQVFTSKPIPINKNPENNFYRADLEFHGIDHSGMSYEARIFLNNESANYKTEQNDSANYVGSFYVFAHGGCFGDAGHCIVKPRNDPYDDRLSHPLTPAFKFLTITKHFNRIMQNIDQITVTVVPIVKRDPDMEKESDMSDINNVLKFEKVKLVTYD